MKNEFIKANYPSYIEKLDEYRKLLVEWNGKMNLTAITEEDDVNLLHFEDSLIGEKFIKENASVIDIGTGAGFPSMPIKIVREDVFLTLNDSLNKRLIFLQEVINALGLEKVKCVHSRAEDLPKTELYDYALSRAVAKLSTLCEYCLPFVKKGGYFIAYKSADTDDEIKDAERAIKTLGGKIEKIETIALSDRNITRRLVFIKKIKDTPSRYPRGKNQPKLRPL